MIKKIDLIAKLFITYVFILSLCFLIYSLVVLPTNGAEKVNAIIGLLGWSATIFAPIAAYFLLDNWKDQKKYEVKQEYLSLILHDIRPIFSKILIIYSNFSNIQKVDYKLIINKDYLDFKSLLIGTQTTYLHGFMKAFSKIDKNEDIIDLYEQLEIHAFFLDNFYNELIKLYKNYYDGYFSNRELTPDLEFDIHREYFESEQNALQNFYLYLNMYMSRIHKYAKRSPDGKEDLVLEYTAEQLLDNIILIHDKIQDLCLNHFEP